MDVFFNKHYIFIPSSLSCCTSILGGFRNVNIYIYIYMVFQGKNTIYKQQERDLSRLSVNLCAHFESSDSFFFFLLLQ